MFVSSHSALWQPEIQGSWHKYSYLACPNTKNDLTWNFCGNIAKGGAYINAIWIK